jgi:dihydrofolate reductase
LFGGDVLIDALLRERAVVELVVGAVPVLLGGGRQLFPQSYPTQELTLRDHSIVSGKVRLEVLVWREDT